LPCSGHGERVVRLAGSVLDLSAVVRAGLAAVAIFAVLATGCGGHGRNPGTIVFQSDRSGHDTLYAVRPDGGGLSRLPLDLPPDGADVYWNQDGTKALVIYDTGSGSNVAYVFESASRTRRSIRLPGPSSISEMPWSPDGRWLVLSTTEGDVVLDVETGKSRRLRDELADDLLTWSPGGKRLLFSAGRDLYTVPANGGPPTQLMGLGRIHPHLPSFADEPGELQWSSDERWISFLDQGLYAVRSDGTGLRLLDHGAEEAAWSPTAERLVFPSPRGLVLVDLGTRRRRQLTRDHLDQDPESLAWSPDGRQIVYLRNDLSFGAGQGFHGQLWTVKADGTDERPVTRAFPDDGTISNASAIWVEGSLKGTPAPRLPSVTLAGARTITTRLPIVGLGAAGTRAAVAQGFGGIGHAPLGPIVVWNPVRRTRVSVAVRGCGSAYDVLLASGRVGYRCDNSGEGYRVDDSLRLGTTELVRTHGDEFTGSFLGGLVADKGTIAFDVESAGNRARREFRIHQTRVWKATGARKAIARTVSGAATVVSLDGGRIAVLRDGKAVSVLSRGGDIRTYAFGGQRILGAALDGPRLVVLQSMRLTVFDLRTSRRAAAWPVRRGFGPAPELEDVQGDLAAYAVGVAVHVLRLSDGREIVIDMPNATDPVFARFVPGGLFYSFNESYDKRPGRLAFVARSELEHAIVSGAAGR
jgi:Tol biopolymer transport system component